MVCGCSIVFAQIIASMPTLHELEAHFDINSHNYTVWNAAVAFNRTLVLDTEVSNHGRLAINAFGTLLEKHLPPFLGAFHPKDLACIFFGFARYDRGPLARFAKRVDNVLSGCIERHTRWNDGRLWTKDASSFPPMCFNSISLSGASLDPAQAIANSAWVRCWLVADLLSYKRQYCLPFPAPVFRC